MESIGIGKDFYQDQGIGIGQQDVIDLIYMTGYGKNEQAYLQRWKTYRDHRIAFETKLEMIKQKLIVAGDAFASTYHQTEFVEMGLWILETGILVNPKEYFVHWKLARGYTHDVQQPNDDLREFFNNELLS